MTDRSVHGIVPCLWFDKKAKEAALFYTSIFPNSRITATSYYGKEGFEIHGQPEGTVLVVAFELDGHPFTAMNGGPQFMFNEAISFQVMCDNQDQIDYYWDKLGEGGDPEAQVCGWLKDKYGLSWQIMPADLDKWVGDFKSAAAQRATRVMLQMKKLVIADLIKAYEGN